MVILDHDSPFLKRSAVITSYLALWVSERSRRIYLQHGPCAGKGALQVAGFFADALKDITFDDALGIWKGWKYQGDGVLQKENRDPIYNFFKPVVAPSMNDVGETRTGKN